MIHQGEPLIVHVVRKIIDQVGHIVISRNREDPRYESLGYPCVSDLLPDHQGPLAGICSCLEQVHTPVVLVVPCDTPNLPHHLVQKMAPLLAGKDVVVASAAGRLQPLIMMIKVSALREMLAYLETGQRSVQGWVETMNHGVAEFGDSAKEFENINRPEQLLT